MKWYCMAYAWGSLVYALSELGIRPSVSIPLGLALIHFIMAIDYIVEGRRK